jgi:hypothetical protein
MIRAVRGGRGDEVIDLATTNMIFLCTQQLRAYVESACKSLFI